MQLHAGAGHDVRDAEGTTYLDQLATGNDAFLACAEAVQGQQHGGGVVVDHGDRLGAGQLADQSFDEVVAIAALAGGEIEFQVERVARRKGDRLDGFIRQQGATEVGVQHRAGEVEHSAHAALVLAGQAFAGAPGEHRFGQFQRGQLATASRFAQFVEQVAQRRQQRLTTIALLQWLAGRIAQQLVHRGQMAAAHASFPGASSRLGAWRL